MNLRVNRAVLGCVAIQLLAGLTSAQIVPDAPVKDFILPMFGESGLKTWDLAGEEGRYVDETRIDVEGMRVRVFEADNPRVVETTLTSPRATILLENQQALGEDFIRVETEQYVIEGRSWFWDHGAGQVRIESGVRVTFHESLEYVLK